VKQSPGLVGRVRKDVEKAVTIPERGRIRIFAGREFWVLKADLYTRYVSIVADENGPLGLQKHECVFDSCDTWLGPWWSVST
jgi:hypothetical protein